MCDSIDDARTDGFALAEVSPDLAESTAANLAIMMQNEHNPGTPFVTRPSLLPRMASKLQPVEYPWAANLTGLVIISGNGYLEVMNGKKADSGFLQPGSVVVFAKTGNHPTWYQLNNRKTIQAVWVESAAAAAYRADKFLIELEQDSFAREAVALKLAKDQELARRRLSRLLPKIGQAANR